mmetsp:Transcript_32707/g.43055  ORF Transcript_32707/g.43055 Transcript_32707/m.43055 type:complete len:200 (-) Transcript_32707:278-877(-)|eukprot:CAMPEP_0117737830 /NCGR_PEP_ID=MMETSP0947-20121206/2761_1 /TAXON_ID=44440 /ORGANISM="Chattonella subsalsa, Strain CCMP2191" /LENGTH=199 /DNA_ID=CAMNT_0005553391 /DNA_START=33 /DNA_END=632 /DNA_ORIENTATION=+
MPCICIGPICIPWVVIWPILIYIFRPIRRIFLQYFEPEKLRKDNEQAESKKTPGISNCSGKACCVNDTDESVEKNREGCNNLEKVQDITTMEEWEGIFAKAKEDGKVIFVDFYSTWCKPCEKVKPEFERLCQIHTNDIFVKTNVDTMTEIAMEHRIMVLPTFVAFNENGEELERVKGGVFKPLEQLISNHSRTPNSDCN